MDTTGSMFEEITAARLRAHSIIQSRANSPGQRGAFLLVPFHDPSEQERSWLTINSWSFITNAWAVYFFKLLRWFWSKMPGVNVNIAIKLTKGQQKGQRFTKNNRKIHLGSDSSLINSNLGLYKSFCLTYEAFCLKVLCCFSHKVSIDFLSETCTEATWQNYLSRSYLICCIPCLKCYKLLLTIYYFYLQV